MGVFAAALLGLAAHARTPGPKLCGGTEAGSRQWAARIVREAQRSFPNLRLRPATGECRCYSGCSRKAVVATEFNWPDPKTNVHFRITPVAIRDDEDAVRADDPIEELKQREARKGKRATYHLEPLADPAAATAMGHKIRRHALVPALLGRKRLYCDAEGATAGGGALYRCSSTASEVSRAAHPGNARWRPVEVRLVDGGGRELILTGYSAPSNLLPDDAPGWVIAREEPTVARFVAANGTVHVELESARQWVLVIRDKPGSRNGLAVKFQPRERAGTAPLVIESVSKVTAP